MTTLTEWLLERIAEDAAVARAAIRATADPTWTTQTYRVVASGEFEVADASVPTATHIARHDPARVLAQCAAHKATVEALEQSATYASSTGGGRAAREALRALATIYADEPGYDPEWGTL